MSIFGDAMGAIRSIIMMQSNLERMDKQIEKLAANQDNFREALFRMSERLTQSRIRAVRSTSARITSPQSSRGMIVAQPDQKAPR